MIWLGVNTKYGAATEKVHSSLVLGIDVCCEVDDPSYLGLFDRRIAEVERLTFIATTRYVRRNSQLESNVSV